MSTATHSFEQLGLIGCGFMGGSFALALKQAGLVKRVIGYSRSPSSSQLGQRMGILDAQAASPQEAAQGSDLVLIAVPVSALDPTLKAIAPTLASNTLVMDVGSTKSDAVDTARRVLRERVGCFVPAHPIAGREVSGIEFADANLYCHKTVIITPIERTETAQIKKAQILWRALGCQVLSMSAQEHDAAYAAVSHLPHLLAFALINSLIAQKQGTNYLSLAGPGFRDFTRIAASEPKMWTDIFSSNREELLKQLAAFEQALHSLQTLISSGDTQTLETLIAQASQTRAQLHTHVAKTSI